MKLNNLQLVKTVPFIEGFCFGANKRLIKLLEYECIYGYGLDVEMGYRTYKNGMKCVVNNEICISHDYGKSYSDIEAKKEYHHFLRINPNIIKFLKEIGIYESI